MRLTRKRVLTVCVISMLVLTAAFITINVRPRMPDPAPTAETPESTPAETPAATPDTAPADGSVIAHDLPRETALPEVRYTEHFARWEFQCDCADACDGFPAEMDSAFLAKLEALRQALGRPVIITSGLRCPTRNAEVGGIRESWHLTGHAADLYCPGVPCTQVADTARSLGMGVIVYPAEAYCHVEYRA